MAGSIPAWTAVTTSTPAARFSSTTALMYSYQ
jgi:hypothetical protein